MTKPGGAKTRILRLALFALVTLCGVLYFLSHSPSKANFNHFLKIRPHLHRPRRPIKEPEVKVERKAQIEEFHLTEGVHYFSSFNVSEALRNRPREYLELDGKKFSYPTLNSTGGIPFLQLSWQPVVFYFPNFLSPEECDHMISLAQPKMQRSHVVPYKNSGASEVQDVRTSSQTWIDSATPMMKAIYERVHRVVGVRDSETMQVLRYEIGQKYSAHNDYFDPVYYGKQVSNRVATFFLYLTTVEEGGETYFPRAGGRPPVSNFDDCTVGLRVRPIRGTAVLFMICAQMVPLTNTLFTGAVQLEEV